jgi:hypothetical protein
MIGRKMLGIVERCLIDALLTVKRESGGVFVYADDGSRWRISVSRKDPPNV